MTGFLLRRLASSALLLLLIATVTFVLLRVAPGEATDRFDDPRIPLEQRERLHRLYGFDRPLTEQYLRWLSATARGDLGYSHAYSAPVVEVLRRFLPPTLLLGSCALSLAVALGLPLGVAAARRPGRRFDRASRLLGALAWATPSFWLGVIALLVFSYRLDLLPALGMSSPRLIDAPSWLRVLDVARHLVLPTLVLALPLAIEIARFARQGLLEVAQEGWLVAARARGLPEGRIWWRHALAHSLPPVLQLLGIAAPAFLSGAVVVEVVFGWPGLGTAATRAAFAQDQALVLAIGLLSGSLVVLGNLLADLGLAVLDPRLR